jgi:hypothetical protein
VDPARGLKSLVALPHSHADRHPLDVQVRHDDRLHIIDVSATVIGEHDTSEVLVVLGHRGGPDTSPSRRSGVRATPICSAPAAQPSRGAGAAAVDRSRA